MRKPLLLLLTGILGISATSAQTPIILKDKSFDLIPANEKNPAPAFAFYNDEDGYRFTIYDEEFNLVKDFNIPSTKYSFSSYAWPPMVVGIKTVHYLEREGYSISEFADLTPEQVCEWIGSNWNEESRIKPRIFTLDDGTVLVGYNYAFYERPIVPTSFVGLFYGKWEKCAVEYNWYDAVMEYIPETKVEYEHEGTISPTSSRVYPITGGDDQSYYLTRGLYSDDFNYVLPEIELITFETENLEERVKYGEDKPIINGFSIYDVDGNKLSSISLPAGYYQEPEINEIEVVSSSGKNYLLVPVVTLSDYQENRYAQNGYAVYKLEGGDNVSVSRIGFVPTNSISPRAPRKGESVSVEVDERFINETCIVSVVSADGRTMLRKEIAPGQKEICFNTAGFAQGLYVVNIAGKAGKIETAKIIVR